MAGADEAGDTRSQASEQGPKDPEQTLQAPAQTPQQPEQATEPVAEQTPTAPGFGERGRMRRRARFLRKARELAYRDLGGLVFDLHRFGQRNDPLVLAKLAALRQVDTELRELEGALGDRRPVTVLREVGIAACPRCAAIHGSDDRFCPACGLAFDAHADRPISTGPIVPQAQISAPASQQPGAPAQISPPSPAAPAPSAATTAPATAQLAGQTTHSPAPLGLPAARRQTGTPASPPVSKPAQPKVEPAPAVKPKVEAAPPVKPTAPPVVAKPASPPAPEPHEPDRQAQEDEPTQILRPPATGR